ncbi:unnamed protein product [Mytilus edulis]|uniref:Uncharacterized protein n=2 Tax=Mytilus TaxID=6548 RepID=A0A8B6DIB6_MYTGA|nr:unnamed protein product [Mytilus edulis]VDI20586.1 Hypothetical predicted protein [Mytilus galloprovincialis]
MSFSSRVSSIKPFKCLQLIPRVICRGSAIHSSANQVLRRQKFDPVKFCKRNASTQSSVLETVNYLIWTPVYQPLSVLLSCAAYIIYFYYLKEDLSNVESNFRKIIYEQIDPGNEEYQEEIHLRNYIRLRIYNNLPTDDYEKRLTQLVRERKAKQNKRFESQ